MNDTLDIIPLRSLVAIADCGGFHRAARVLHLSQPTVSQHVRRLESVTGRTLMERDGRHSKLTTHGEILLDDARRILALHDAALRRLGAHATPDVVVGTTEHGADRLLPEIAASLRDTLPGTAVRFRVDRGAPLSEALDRGDIDLAMLLGSGTDDRSRPAGQLQLRWYAAPSWNRDDGDRQLPLVAFNSPCAIRERALKTLASNGIDANVVCDAAYLAGMLAAIRSGLGVGLLATVGKAPEGLVERTDLPAAEPMPLSIRSRRGFDGVVATKTARALTAVLNTHEED